MSRRDSPKGGKSKFEFPKWNYGYTLATTANSSTGDYVVLDSEEKAREVSKYEKEFRDREKKRKRKRSRSRSRSRSRDGRYSKSKKKHRSRSRERGKDNSKSRDRYDSLERNSSKRSRVSEEKERSSKGRRHRSRDRSRSRDKSRRHPEDETSEEAKGNECQRDEKSSSVETNNASKDSLDAIDQQSESDLKPITEIIGDRNPIMFCKKQSRIRKLPMAWEELDATGVQKNRKFSFRLTMGEYVVIGADSSKKGAKQKAAETMARKLDEIFDLSKSKQGKVLKKKAAKETVTVSNEASNATATTSQMQSSNTTTTVSAPSATTQAEVQNPGNPYDSGMTASMMMTVPPPRPPWMMQRAPMMMSGPYGRMRGPFWGRYQRPPMARPPYGMYAPPPMMMGPRPSIAEILASGSRGSSNNDSQAGDEDEDEQTAPKWLNPSANNPISKIYEHCKRHRLSEPIFEIINENIIETKKTVKGILIKKTEYTMQVTMQGRVHVGVAMTKKEAKYKAAEALWADICSGPVQQDSISDFLQGQRKQAEN